MTTIAGRTTIEDLPRLCPLLWREGKTVPEPRSETRPVRVGDLVFGGERAVVIAGPCAVESRAQTLELAHAVKAAGGDMLRGGAFKPRTSPHAFQGLGLEGLKILREASEQTGLPVVTEVMDVRQVELCGQYVDMLQVGSRNMQNYPLLVELGRFGKPVLLKRGVAASLVEWLGAAEYLALEGNFQIVLCERGIKTLAAGEYTRYSLDLGVVPAVRQFTFLPVIVDPSHATGVAAMVEAASLAALAFGGQGLMLEIRRSDPQAPAPVSDAEQAITPQILARIARFAHAAQSTEPLPETIIRPAGAGVETREGL